MGDWCGEQSIESNFGKVGTCQRSLVLRAPARRARSGMGRIRKRTRDNHTGQMASEVRSPPCCQRFPGLWTLYNVLIVRGTPPSEGPAPGRAPEVSQKYATAESRLPCC